MASETKGRLDWMSRKKVWRVIWYKGRKDVPMGDYLTREEAVNRLSELITGISREYNLTGGGR